MKIGTMATYPPRIHSLLETLPTILGQLDRLYLYCNKYEYHELEELNDWINDLGFDAEICLIEAKATGGNIKDMGKFWSLGTMGGYIFLLDDDLLYPKDYCQQHITAIEKHRSFSCVHGRRIKEPPLEDYFEDTKSFHYRNKLDKPVKVDIAGTGTTAFKTAYQPDIFATKADMSNFKEMADIWLASQANLRGIDIYCLPRTAKWLKDTEAVKELSTLYDKTKSDTSRHCQTLNNLSWN